MKPDCCRLDVEASSTKHHLCKHLPHHLNKEGDSLVHMHVLDVRFRRPTPKRSTTTTSTNMIDDTMQSPSSKQRNMHKFVLPRYHEARRRFCKQALLIMMTTVAFLVQSGLMFYAFVPDTTCIISVQRTIDDGSALQFEFESKWLEIKRSLCPKMVPKSAHLGPRLFAAARSELGMKNPSAGGQHAEEPLFTNFFRFSPANSFRYISPKNNETTLFLGIWKCANDQIRFGTELLFQNQPGDFLMGKPEVDEESARRVLHSINNRSCIITAVRDPVSHFLAGYNEEESRCIVDSNPNCPTTQTHPHLYVRYQHGTKQHFEQFVADFLGGWKPAGINHEHHHVYSMTGWLYKLAKSDLKLSAYLPTLSNLTETFPKFLVNSCTGVPKIIRNKSLQQVTRHASQADSFGFYKAAKEVWREEGPTARALCALHAIDYACFDDLPDIPNICKQVFVSVAFRNRVFGILN